MAGLTKWFSKYAGWGPVILRVVVAVVLISHGWQKLTNLGSTANFFVTTFGQPAWLASVAMAIEFFGGILILLGLFARYASALVALEMAYIIVFVLWAKGLAGFQLELMLFAAGTALAFSGPGKLSLEKALFKKEY
jgi:putative oxidoreductase